MAAILGALQPKGRGLRHLIDAVTQRLESQGYRCGEFTVGNDSKLMRAIHQRTGHVVGFSCHTVMIGKHTSGGDRTLLDAVRQALAAADGAESVVAVWGRFAPYRLGTTLVVGVRGWQ